MKNKSESQSETNESEKSIKLYTSFSFIDLCWRQQRLDRPIPILDTVQISHKIDEKLKSDISYLIRHTLEIALRKELPGIFDKIKIEVSPTVVIVEYENRRITGYVHSWSVEYLRVFVLHFVLDLMEFELAHRPPTEYISITELQNSSEVKP